MKRAFIALFCLFITLTGICQLKITIQNGCSYTGETGQTEITAWESNEGARSALDRIMKFTGLPQNFIIMAADVPNAAAITYESRRFILYNQSFIQKIRDYTNSDWSAISILAHEIGHHLSGHNLDNLGSRPSKELEADLFSGFVLYKMGATLDEATRAMQIVSEYGSATHPGRSARIAAITRGWMQSKAAGAQTQPEIQQSSNTPTYRNASQNELVQKYTGYSQQAANYYNAGNFKAAEESFKNSLSIFELLQTKGYISNQTFDTTTTLYTGISAEKANDPAAAAWYYGKIADRKCTGEGFVEIYKWLADYHKRNGDILKALKFLALGRDVYPNDPFWMGFELDMTRDSGNKDALFNKYEQTIRDNPNNHLYLFNYGVELYQTGYDPDVSKRPGNSEQLIARAIEVMKRTLAIKPDFANAHMVLGQIYYNQGVEINNTNKEIRPQYGARLTAEQINRKNQLREQMFAKFDQAQPYLAKVVSLLDVQGRLRAEDKDNLKNALDLLITITEEKINQLEYKKRADSNSNVTSELSSLQAEVAKYNQLLNSINSRH
jgi:predicted Zn-dependent protease